MKDFKIVTVNILLPVHSVAPIRGMLPVAIVALGSGMDTASKVLYNDIQVTDFVRSSPTRLIIKVPDSQIGKEFKTLRVYTNISTVGSEAALTFELSKPPVTVSGLRRLIQSWMMIFYTNPGSDIFNPTSGGGARSIIGQTTDRKGKGVSADLALCIENTKSELIRLQARVPYLPLSEKLLSADLGTIEFSGANSMLTATVSIKNALGDTAEVSLG